MKLRHGVRAALLLLVACGSEEGVSGATETVAGKLPRIAPRSPSAARDAFQLSPELRIELVAAEPLVADPVDLEFDANGDLWVVEMIDYPYDAREDRPARGRIRRLRDDDGDGRMDRSTVFADRISWPTSLALWKGGVFVAAAPDILWLEDSDADGRADRREVVFTGFGRDNVQALLNNLEWSPTGWFVGAGGGNGGEIRSLRQAGVAPRLVRGRDFRFRPTGAFEPLTGGGQFGHSLDDFGNRFVCNNSDHARHVVLEQRHLGDLAGIPLPPLLASIAAEGPSAPVFRLSPPEPWRVVRTRLRVQGQAPGPIEHGGRHSGYFTSATGITVYRGSGLPGCYGNLFIGDVASNLVHRKRLAPNGVTFRAERADPGREFLAARDIWFRPVNFANGPDGSLYVCDMYREVVEHPRSLPDGIREQLDLESGNERGRIWRVTGTDAKPWRRPSLGDAGPRELVAALRRKDAWWRNTASRLLVERRDLSSVRGLVELMRDPEPAVRATALSTLHALDALAEEDLVAALGDAAQGVRALAASLAETRRSAGVQRALAGLVSDPSRRVRLQAACSLGADATAAAALARLAETDGSDPWIGTAVLSAARQQAARLFERTKGSAPPAFLERLAAILGAAGPNPADNPVARWLAHTEPGRRACAVAVGFASGLQRRGQELAGELAARHSAWAEATLLEDAAPLADRKAALRFLGCGPPKLASTLTRLFAPGVPPELQVEAVRSLSRHPGALADPLTRWKYLTPAVRRALVHALCRRPRTILTLLDAIEDGRVPGHDIDFARRRSLLRHRSAKVRQRAARTLGAAGSIVPQPVLNRFRRALAGTADPARGQAAYRAHCRTCHRFHGEGDRRLGPDLETVQAWSRERILTHVLDPDREVSPAYMEYVVVTHEGDELFGRIAAETATSITLERADGRETIGRRRIASIEATGSSVMPAGWERQIPPTEMRDLIGWITASPWK